MNTVFILRVSMCALRSLEHGFHRGFQYCPSHKLNKLIDLICYKEQSVGNIVFRKANQLRFPKRHCAANEMNTVSSNWTWAQFCRMHVPVLPLGGFPY